MTTEYHAIDSHIERLKNTVYTSIPAKVTKVNKEGGAIHSVSAKPVNDKLWRDGLLLTRKPIHNIPLVFPSGGGGVLSFPVKEDDYVLLLFSQEDIDNFLVQGNDSGKPNTLRKFSLTDAIAIPCVYPLGNDLKPSQDDVELKFNDNKITLKKDGSVKVETASTISVSNPQEELIALLSEVIETLENTTVNTIYGASPLNSKPQLASLKQRLDTFKE